MSPHTTVVAWEGDPEKLSIVLDYLIHRYTDRELDIILRRLDGETLQSIAERHKISAERVRQIVSRYKRKIRWWRKKLKAARKAAHNS